VCVWIGIEYFKLNISSSHSESSDRAFPVVNENIHYNRTFLAIHRSAFARVASFLLSFAIKRMPVLVDAYVRTIGGGFYLEVSCLRPGYDDIPPAWPVA